MTQQTKDKLINSFWDGLEGWDWESWRSAGSSDKETIAADAILEVETFLDLDVEEVYDLFWEWADGLDRDCFEDEDDEEEEDEDEEDDF